MRRLILLALLSSSFYTAVPSSAQDRDVPRDRERIIEDVRRTDREAAESARRWSMENRIPRRIVQSDGGVIELIYVVDGHPVYLVPANRTSATITRTRSLYPGERLGLDLTGSGLEIGIWDSGHVRGDHQELSGRVSYGDEAEPTDHATHVGGTIAAEGIDSRARGMAYESALKSYSWTNDATEMTNEASAGLLLSNHSYSILSGWHYGDLENEGDQWYWVGDPSISTDEDYLFGWYDVPAVQYDRVTHTHPYFLPVVASGNDRLDTGPSSGTYRARDTDGGGYLTHQIAQRPIPRDGGASGFDTISGAGVAKNALTVGSVGLSSVTGLSRTSAFSSFGPTDDGRIKPDLMGVGENVFSLSSGNRDDYGVSSGTSMSTPNVTGSLLLLQQYYHDLYGAFMRAATLKGLVLHTAQDLDLPGPDYRSGWGLLNTEAAAELITTSSANTSAVLESYLDDGEVFQRDIRVEESGPVRVTLSWTDPPSVRLARRGPSTLDDPTTHLKNDLDLRLVHEPTGRSYEPFVLDPMNPDQPAFSGDNRVDPVEQIYIPAADTGRYVLTVSHKGTLTSRQRQPFSILITGAAGEPLPVAVARLTADASVDGVVLRWSTLFERSEGIFEVERAASVESSGKTVDDGDFVKIGELSVPGGGARDYEFSDEWSLAGRYVYRIVHVSGGRRFVAARTEVNIPAPESYDLLSSYPNPFRDQATLVLDLPKTQHVTLEVFDLLGRRLLTAFEGELGAGRHRMPIDGESWPAGLYFARVTTPNGIVTHRMIRQ